MIFIIKHCLLKIKTACINRFFKKYTYPYNELEYQQPLTVIHVKLKGQGQSKLTFHHAVLQDKCIRIPVLGLLLVFFSLFSLHFILSLFYNILM